MRNVGGQLRSPEALLPGKKLGYDFNRKLGEVQSRSAGFGEETKFLPRQEFETRTIQPVA